MTIRIDHLVFGRSPNPAVTGFRVLGYSEGIDSTDVQHLGRRANVGQALAYRSSEYHYEAFERLPSGRWVFSVRRPSRSRDGSLHPYSHMFVGSPEDFRKVGNPFATFDPNDSNGSLASYTESDQYHDFRGHVRFPRLELDPAGKPEASETLDDWRIRLQAGFGEKLRVWLCAIYCELAGKKRVVLPQTADNSLELLVKWIWLGLPSADRLNTPFSTHVAPLQWGEYDLYNVPEEFRHHISGVTPLSWSRAQELGGESADPVHAVHADWLLEPGLRNQRRLWRIFSDTGWRVGQDQLRGFVAYRTISQVEGPSLGANDLKIWLGQLETESREWLDIDELARGLVHHLTRRHAPGDPGWDVLAEGLDRLSADHRHAILRALRQHMPVAGELPWARALVSHPQPWSSDWAASFLSDRPDLFRALGADQAFQPTVASWLAKALEAGTIGCGQLDSLVPSTAARDLLVETRNRSPKFSDLWFELSARIGESDDALFSIHEAKKAVSAGLRLNPRLTAAFLGNSLARANGATWLEMLEVLRPGTKQIADSLDGAFQAGDSPALRQALAEALAWQFRRPGSEPGDLLQIQPRSVEEADFRAILLRVLSAQTILPDPYARIALDSARALLPLGSDSLGAALHRLLKKGWDEPVAGILREADGVGTSDVWSGLADFPGLARHPHTYQAVVDRADAETRAVLADRLLEDLQAEEDTGSSQRSLIEWWMVSRPEFLLERLGRLSQGRATACRLKILACGAAPPRVARHLQDEVLQAPNQGGNSPRIAWLALAQRYPPFSENLMEKVASDPDAVAAATGIPSAEMTLRLAIALARGLVKESRVGGGKASPAALQRACGILRDKVKFAKYMEKQILMVYGERLSALSRGPHG